MSKELWTAVDRYFQDKLLPSDPVFEEALSANASAGLPAIDVAPNQGKLLHLLARVQRARRILEIGTLGGYSTIWLGRALPPDGKLITLESQPKHAVVALENVRRAGLSSVIQLRLGPALESLQALESEGEQPFDFIFIDADKPNIPAYIEWSVRLSRPGTIIVCDNVVRGGAILDPETDDPTVRGIRTFLEKIAADPRLDATAIQTVGSKGHDGFAFALVLCNGQ